MYKIGYVMFYGFISQISAKFKSAFSLINVIGSFGSHKNTLPLTLGSLRIGFMRIDVLWTREPLGLIQFDFRTHRPHQSLK